MIVIAIMIGIVIEIKKELRLQVFLVAFGFVFMDCDISKLNLNIYTSLVS